MIGQSGHSDGRDDLKTERALDTSTNAGRILMKPALAIALIAVPIGTAGLWLASGREILTKSAKAVSVSARDELFGETFVQQEDGSRAPPPVLGYYVGLDLVIVVTAVCLVLSIVAWWVARRKVSGCKGGSAT